MPETEPKPALAVIGATQLRDKVEVAATRLGCVVIEHAAPGTIVAVVAASYPGATDGPQLAGEALQRGAASVIGVAPEHDTLERLAMFDVGAADVIGPSVSAEELVCRIERLAVLRRWSQSLQVMVEESAHDAERQRALFQAVVDALPLSLHVIDTQSRIVVWNRGRETGPFGRPRGEVLGRQLWDVIGQHPALHEEYANVLASGQSSLSEVQSLAGTSPRIFQVEKLPMRLGVDGAVSHVLTVSRDVTAARQMERSMAQTDKIAAVGRLAAGIAHEIKNPLATIAGCAEAMQERLRGEFSAADRQEAAEDAAVVEGEAYRCKEILEGLLDFSRSQPSEPQRCDLDSLARRAVRLLRHNPRVDSMTIELNIAPDLPQPLVNEDQIVQVLLALVLNAADAAPRGRITISARCGLHGEAILSVEDDGPGVPREIQARIFEPFFTTKPTGQGTGLGLAVAYGLVKAHGGQLDLIPQSGRGARFDIVLPADAEVMA